MLRLLMWRPSRKSTDRSVYCVLRFPDSTESRWFDHQPAPGMRIRSHREDGTGGKVWVVDEVLQSGRETYTVFCVARREYLDKLRHGSGVKPDLATELLEAARHASDAVMDRRRRWKYRRYQP